MKQDSLGRLNWVDNELSACILRLDAIEELESSAWTMIADVEGRTAQTKRMERWKEWHARQAGKICHLKSLSWDAQSRATSNAEDRGAHGCHLSRGYVKKVKLPTFSGKQEEFVEFRSQFHELCQGEGYTLILEMAQLRLKLPREAINLIAGLQSPTKAWKRLEELYGNRELSILSAIRNLREFKSSKSAAHEQVIKLVSAVQKCQMELQNVKATCDLLGDRESVASIIQALPLTIRDKWYDRKVPEDTYKKGRYLMKWLEEQRQNAVRVRMDVMATRLRAPVTSGVRNAQQVESTDKGLMSSSLHTQGVVKTQAQGSGSSQPVVVESSSPSGARDRPVRIDVKTSQDAMNVAERRKKNLEQQKLDKCPICAQCHYYEQTWTSVQPPVKTRLLSTHLTMCPKFLGM